MCITCKMNMTCYDLKISCGGFACDTDQGLYTTSLCLPFTLIEGICLGLEFGTEWDCSENGMGRGAIEASLHTMAQGMTLSGALGIPVSTGRMKNEWYPAKHSALYGHSKYLTFYRLAATKLFYTGVFLSNVEGMLSS